MYMVQVTWVEHAEYDESVVHRLYRPLIAAGMGFGAQRWVTTLQRQCECLAILMSSSVPTRDHTGIIYIEKNLISWNYFTWIFHEKQLGWRQFLNHLKNEKIRQRLNQGVPWKWFHGKLYIKTPLNMKNMKSWTSVSWFYMNKKFTRGWWKYIFSSILPVM